MGNNDKHVEIDKIIEADYKYFGCQTKSRDKEIYKIRTQAKNVDIILNKRNQMLQRQKMKRTKELVTEESNP